MAGLGSTDRHPQRPIVGDSGLSAAEVRLAGRERREVGGKRTSAPTGNVGTLALRRYYFHGIGKLKRVDDLTLFVLNVDPIL
jgi:hypothetical protein